MNFELRRFFGIEWIEGDSDVLLDALWWKERYFIIDLMVKNDIYFWKVFDRLNFDLPFEGVVLKEGKKFISYLDVLVLA